MATAAWKSQSIHLDDGVHVEVSVGADGVSVSHSTADGVLVGDMRIQPDDACLLGCYLMQAAAECRVLRAQ